MTSLNHDNNLCLVTLPSPSPSADSAELASKLVALEKVKELCEFLTNTKNHQNEPKNILVNLCSGLETFLGFDYTSKGYTGKGIVYSDLDRLCDAVMGFLFSIITDVNKNENLKKYNTKLPEILDKIKLAKYNRKTHFGSSIVAVSRGIREWVSGVEERNESVLAPLNDLQELLNNHIKIDMERKPITEQLENWQGFSSLYLREADESQKSLDNIDDNLKEKIAPKIELMQQMAHNFWSSVNNDGVKNSVKELSDGFSRQHIEVKRHIGAKINEALDTINSKLSTIETKIDKVKQAKESHFRTINAALQVAQKLAEKLVDDKGEDGFEQTYNENLMALFITIKKEIEKFTKEGSFSKAALLTEFDKVKEGVAGLEDNVRHGLEQLKKDIQKVSHDVYDNDANSIVKSALEALQKQKSALDVAYGKASGPSNNLKAKYSGDSGRFHEQFESLMREITQLNTSGITNGLTQLASTVTVQLDALAKIHTETKTTVDLTFTKLTGDGSLNGSGGPITNLYEDIKAKVGQYVEQLKSALQAGIDSQNGVPFDAGAPKTPGLDKLMETLQPKSGSLFTFFGQAKSKNGVAYNIEVILRDLKKAIEMWKVDSSSTGSADLLDEFQKALKEQFNTKIDEAKGEPLNKILEAAAKHGTEEFKKELEKSINGSDGNGIHGQIGREIEKLKHPSKQGGDAFQEAFKNFEDKLRGLQQSTKGTKSTEADVQRHVYALIDAVDSLNDSINDFDDQAREQIKEAADKAIAEVVEKFQMVRGQDKINVRVMMPQLNTAKDALTKACKLISQELYQLKKLPNTVEDKKVEAESKMKHLKSRILHIKQKINAIKEPITLADRAFESAITDFVTALADARSETSIAMSMLQVDLQRQVTQAFNDLEDGAQTMFAKQKKTELQAIHTAVEDQISSLKSLIDSDMERGFKGLMGNLQTALQSHPIQHSDTKLHLYATTVKTFLGKFMEDVTWQPDVSSSPDHLTPLADALSALLSTMHSQRHFDHTVSTKLAELQAALDTLTPSGFAEASPLLNVVKAGVRAFHGELAKQYVNRYSGKVITWLTLADKDGKQEPTKDALNCGKVFFSCLPMLMECLGELERRCADGGSWSTKSLYLKEEDRKVNSLGEFMRQCGYCVQTDKTTKQDGELICKFGFKGSDIYSKLTEKKMDSALNVTEHLKKCDSNTKPGTDVPVKKDNFYIFDLLRCLYKHLDQYNEAYHLSTLTSKRHPCSVYEMLVWLSGLPHNPIYSAARDERVLEILEELNEDEERKADEEEPHAGEVFKVSYMQHEEISINAHPRKLPYKDICDAVTYICSNAYDVLTTISGTGDELTTYASDLSNNSMKFYYPQSGEDCFDMLLDILRRLFPPLKFLLSQCSYAAYNFGWRDCMYGKDIQSGKSQCIDHSEDKAACQPKGKANGQPTCQVNSQANCHPTSPLMSYLNDCLPGHLPHQLSKIGCRYECVNCPSTAKKGMPCLTPLGFRGFSGSTKTGKEICHIIRKFISNAHLKGLLCLVPKPPSTISEHFSFVQSLANSCGSSKSMNLTDLQSAFEASVDMLSIQLQPNVDDLPKALLDAYGSKSATHANCEHPHLTTLTTTDTCKGKKKNVDCAPFIYPLSEDAYCYFAMKHCDTYVSWAVYLPWTFWQYLKNLCDDFCNIFCADWGCRSCLNSGKCKRGEHGKSDEAKEGQPPSHYCKCDSMVKCKGVSPTFYRYGFAFGDPTTLNTGKKCHDFYNQFTAVLNSQYFKDLFDKCDEFLLNIRWPFMLTVLSLWLLSLLYLLHIMVIRLDLLHIKSHLHSPSSHRIAAQSLLAAARVNKLNRVFYLQP